MKQLLAAILLSLALVVAVGCGDDGDGKDGPAATTDKPAEESTSERPGTTEATPPAEASEDDREAVQKVVVDWTFEGSCNLMTDKFLEAQLLGIGENRQERCDLFEKQHQRPQYSEDDMKIEDVKVTGTKASLIVTSELAPDIKSRYDLVKNGTQWQIDAAELE